MSRHVRSPDQSDFGTSRSMILFRVSDSDPERVLRICHPVRVRSVGPLHLIDPFGQEFIRLFDPVSDGQVGFVLVRHGSRYYLQFQ